MRVRRPLKVKARAKKCDLRPTNQNSKPPSIRKGWISISTPKGSCFYRCLVRPSRDGLYRGQGICIYVSINMCTPSLCNTNGRFTLPTARFFLQGNNIQSLKTVPDRSGWAGGKEVTDWPEATTSTKALQGKGAGQGQGSNRKSESLYDCRSAV